MRKRLMISFMVGLLTLASAMPVFAAPKQMADGNMFDAQYYATNNPDVVAVFGTDETMLYSHYANCGKNEGRKPFAEGTVTPKFDAVYYAKNNPDVVAVFGTDETMLYNHYVNCGKKEGRIPCENGVPFMEVALLEAPVQPQTPTVEIPKSNGTFPYELFVLYYDNMGYPYFYYIGLNNPYLSEEDLAKQLACRDAQWDYMCKHFSRPDDSISVNYWWDPAGERENGDPIYMHCISECNGVRLPSPQARGIYTSGRFKYRE